MYDLHNKCWYMTFKVVQIDYFVLCSFEQITKNGVLYELWLNTIARYS